MDNQEKVPLKNKTIIKIKSKTGQICMGSQFRYDGINFRSQLLD